MDTINALSVDADRNDADPEEIAFFGRIALVHVNWQPGRFGLASTPFEILSFQPVRMRTQVSVWSLARKASNHFTHQVMQRDSEDTNQNDSATAGICAAVRS